MDASQLIYRYEQLSLLTEQMRAAAEQNDWDRLVELEVHRSQMLAEVMFIDATVALNVAESQRRNACIESALEHDAEIRTRVQTHLSEIQRDLFSNQNTQRLKQAYGV